MNQNMNWQYKELYPDKREKLIQFLTSELIFLEESIKQTKIKKEIKVLYDARKKVDNLLRIQLENIEKVSSDDEFEDIISRVYHILNKVIDKIK